MNSTKFFILILVLGISSSLSAQSPVSIRLVETPIEKALIQIERESGFTFSYNPELLQNFPKVTANFQGASLKNVLSALFDKTTVQYIIKDRQIILNKRSNLIKTRTINGYIYDRESTETLIGASVFDKFSGRGTVSNNYGFFSLTVPETTSELHVSYIGYATQTFRINTIKNDLISIYLEPNIALETVEVRGNKLSNLQSTDVGKITMLSTELKSVPTFLGESDIVKTLQLTPGVTQGTEGIAGMYVRGGNLDENLYLVDGNPVYHVNHMLGIFSTFNSDAVKLMNFYKGSFPARFGGRLSSVVDMRMNDGDSKKIGGTVSVGLIASRFNLNGPIVKDKTTFNISLRRTYLDLFTTPMFAIINHNMKKWGDDYIVTMKMGYNFYDLNGKISHKFSDRSRLFLSLYAGNDKMKGKYSDTYKENRDETNDYNPNYFVDENDEMKIRVSWGTKLTSLNWAYQFNSRLYASNTLIFSQYKSDITSSEEKQQTYEPKSGSNLPERSENYSKSALYGSGITDIGVRSDFDFTPAHNHYVRFGASLINHYFRPEHTQISSIELNDSLKYERDFIYANDSVNVFETSLYVEDEMDVSDKIKLNVGAHISNFSVEKQNYFSFQPRMSTRYLWNENLSLKVSYAQMTQYLHLLQSSYLTLPNDLWMPITKNIKPLISHQVAGGVYWDYGQFNFSMEGYYKTSKNQMEYKEGTELFMAGKNWEDRVTQGNGKAYGVEWMANKRLGKTTGWAGYTLSWATRHFPNGEINDGKPYFAKYDNRHKINLVVNHRFNPKIDVNASWILASGNWLTLPREKYTSVENYTEFYFSERNNYKIPAYHRLDLSVNFTKQKKRGTRIWNVSVYNAYFRKNAFLILPVENDYWSEGNHGHYVKTESEYQKISIFPIIPSVSYTFKF